MFHVWWWWRCSLPEVPGTTQDPAALSAAQAQNKVNYDIIIQEVKHSKDSFVSDLRHAHFFSHLWMQKIQARNIQGFGAFSFNSLTSQLGRSKPWASGTFSVWFAFLTSVCCPQPERIECTRWFLKCLLSCLFSCVLCFSPTQNKLCTTGGKQIKTKARYWIKAPDVPGDLFSSSQTTFISRKVSRIETQQICLTIPCNFLWFTLPSA